MAEPPRKPPAPPEPPSRPRPQPTSVQDPGKGRSLAGVPGLPPSTRAPAQPADPTAQPKRPIAQPPRTATAAPPPRSAAATSPPPRSAAATSPPPRSAAAPTRFPVQPARISQRQAPPAARPAESRSQLLPRARLSTLRLLVWPVLLSAAMTLLRLVGERRGWSQEYWNRLPGGGLSPLGIIWLVPLIAFYFGWRLRARGQQPRSWLQALVQPPAALLLLGGGLVLIDRMRDSSNMPPLSWSQWLIMWAAAAAVAGALALQAWPALGRVLLGYAVLARAVVVGVMGFAIHRHWGTHYDAPPPGFPEMPWLRQWLWTGVLLQLTVWIAVTLAAGVACGTLGALAQPFGARLRRSERSSALGSVRQL